MREIVLDTETTGLDPAGGDRVVEIGCVELLNHIPTGQVWHHYFNPRRTMPRAAFDIHGLSEEFLADKPDFEELAGAFCNFINGAKLVIHNASFDVGFLNAELARAAQPAIENSLVVDTLALARRRHPGAMNSLDALCKRYGIDNAARTKHGALLDAELLADVYIELIGGRQTHLTLLSKEAANAASLAAATIAARPQALPSRLSDAEEAAHADAIAALGKGAAWRKYDRN